MKCVRLITIFSAMSFIHALAQDASGPQFAVVVGAGSAYETTAELVQVARSASAGLKCGAGRGTPGCDGFARATGAKVVTVNYKAAGAVANDLSDGQLDFGLLSAEDAKLWVGNGKVRVLR